MVGHVEDSWFVRLEWPPGLPSSSFPPRLHSPPPYTTPNHQPGSCPLPPLLPLLLAGGLAASLSLIWLFSGLGYFEAGMPAMGLTGACSTGGGTGWYRAVQQRYRAALPAVVAPPHLASHPPPSSLLCLPSATHCLHCARPPFLCTLPAALRPCLHPARLSPLPVHPLTSHPAPRLACRSRRHLPGSHTGGEPACQSDGG